jgi:hypothetical protein
MMIHINIITLLEWYNIIIHQWMNIEKLQKNVQQLPSIGFEGGGEAMLVKIREECMIISPKK